MRRQLLMTAAAVIAASLGFILIPRKSSVKRQWPYLNGYMVLKNRPVNFSDATFACNTSITLTSTDATGQIGSTSHDFASQPTKQPAPKIVLGWTPMYHKSTWWWLKNDGEYASELIGTDCIFTTNRSYLSSADLVVFHGCFQPHRWFSYPDYRLPSQRWVYIMSEAPTSRYCANNFVPADGLFNLTATYKRDSDLVFSYSPGFVPRNEVVTGARTQELTKNKTKIAFWYMSDCSSEWSSRRSEYVKELRRYVSVDVFGTCRTYIKDTISPPCPKSSDDSMDRCFLNQSKPYKFYLSFENSHCRDYITEKLFKVLRPESDVVPIVMGPSIDDYTAVTPPDSFIHVSNFSSPQHLAAYLHYLDKNDNEYMAYLRWRDRFVMLPIPGKNSNDQHPPSQLRQLCAAAHRPPPPRVWADLVSWFSIKKDCKVAEDLCETYGICNQQGLPQANSTVFHPKI